MAQVLEFEASSHASIEIKGTWYKFGCSMRVKLDESDDLELIKRKTWNTVNLEIEKQVEETVAELR